MNLPEVQRRLFFLIFDLILFYIIAEELDKKTLDELDELEDEEEERVLQEYR